MFEFESIKEKFKKKKKNNLVTVLRNSIHILPFTAGAYSKETKTVKSYMKLVPCATKKNIAARNQRVVIRFLVFKMVGDDVIAVLFEEICMAEEGEMDMPSLYSSTFNHKRMDSVYR